MAHCLRLRFERDGVPKDIEDAQQMLESVIASTALGSVVHTKAVYGLGRVYETLYHYTGLSEYVGQAHDCFGRTLDGLETMKEEDATMELELLVGLAWCLNTIPARKANAEALRLCAAVLHEAVDTDSVYTLALYGMSTACYTRWDMSGRQEKTDLINSQDYARRAAQNQHRLRFRHLKWLATICRERTDGGDDVAYVNEAIERGAEAVEIIKQRQAPASHDVATVLIALGLAYHTRYRVQPDPEDLENAINLHRRALGTIAYTPFSARHTLVDCLCDRYQALGFPKDIEDAVETVKQALEEAPDGSVDKSLSIANVGRTLALRYCHGKEDSDFRSAKQALEDASAMFQSSDGYPPGLLVFVQELLAKIHDVHFQVHRREEDAEMSIRYMEDAIATKKEFALDLGGSSPRSSRGSEQSMQDACSTLESPINAIHITISRETTSDDSPELTGLAPVHDSLSRFSIPA
ncbi:hypothetical protein CALCODRAFT_192841 [Calocera cornea HHB12733]|uniref:TPR-like protein n=1 Tax=Calocera cornea HHB12733 TaxID=1353952 RepID=A0A165C7L0_9BASI|nr:hypothetical protein CALCODRAFT_192841 [Calocera cornea HHB12733]